MSQFTNSSSPQEVGKYVFSLGPNFATLQSQIVMHSVNGEVLLSFKSEVDLKGALLELDGNLTNLQLKVLCTNILKMQSSTGSSSSIPRPPPPKALNSVSTKPSAVASSSYQTNFSNDPNAIFEFDVVFYDETLGFQVGKGDDKCSYVFSLTVTATMSNLKQGDKIIAYNGKPINRHEEFIAGFSTKVRPITIRYCSILLICFSF
jgi:hypothetical protein